MSPPSPLHTPLTIIILLLLNLTLAPTAVQADSFVRNIFKAASAYKTLTIQQRICAAEDALRSVTIKSPCEDKDCFCADPQSLSDATDRCTIALHEFNGVQKYYGMHTAETYNGIMSFFASECGTFEAKLKTTESDEITYAPTLATGTPKPSPSTAANPKTSDATDSPTEERPSGNEPSQSSSGLGTGPIIGIAIAGVSLLSALLGVAYKIRKHRRLPSRNAAASNTYIVNTQPPKHYGY